MHISYRTTPNGHKITIILDEAGLPYRIVPVNISAGERIKPEFLPISPNNRILAIVDDDPLASGAPVIVFESGATLLYLADKSGESIPRDVRGQAEVLPAVTDASRTILFKQTAAAVHR